MKLLSLLWKKEGSTFRADMSSSVRIDNNKKSILILFEDPTQRLEDITLPVEAKYSINFPRSHKKICLSLHYNRSNTFLFVNATKIYQVKAKDSEIENICCF